MSKVILTLDCMPVACDKCPLFVNHFGQKAYCVMHAEYTPEEIAAVENGNLHIYYYGCLPKRPNECPLEEVEEPKEIPKDNSSWDFHWDGRGSYEESRREFYGEFS